MPTGFETEAEAQERLLRASQDRYAAKAETSSNVELQQVEREKAKSLQSMQAELRRHDALDRVDRLKAHEKVGAVLKVAAEKTWKESKDSRSKYMKAQFDSTKEVGAATLAAAGALAIDAGTDVATVGVTTIPGFSHLKDMASTKAANEMYRAATGKDEDMVKGIDNVIAFVGNFIPGLNSVVSPATVAALRISLTEGFKQRVRDVKLAAEMLPAVVNNVRDANEALTRLSDEQKRNSTRETSLGNAQQVSATA